ncbi:dynein heavy chain, cytosolic [Trypanosoma theileri]|uniref:Dynein heavy chain, cytosolic n=1 Tax=Trypanosoma theileri TaxID=67003 RepID=A0A1X0NQ11_9TRYP|nr:dynein heavy chain, cytosolic [Trypanosoma theileri]ORC86691.1 dynein heavy chain, cytosolic [Trypanosoma theileri]
MPKPRSGTSTATASPHSDVPLHSKKHGDVPLHSKKQKKPPLSLEEVRRNGYYVQMSVDDLVAYEYVDAHQQWQWGLATVAALPGPRLVQLLLWRSDDALLNSENNNLFSPEEAKGRLAALEESRAAVSAEAAVLNRTLAAQRATYAANRRAVEADAIYAARVLAEARLRLREIDASDWREIRAYHNPPAMVVLVMEAVLTLLGVRVMSWPQIKGYIRGNEFVHTVEQFDPAKISEATRNKVKQRYLSNPKFTYADAMNGSQALGYLQQWVVAQMSTASATESLTEYDIAHSKERAAINDMENQIEAFEQTLRDYSNEEGRLRTMLGDPPLVISNDYTNSNSQSMNNNTSHNYNGNNINNSSNYNNGIPSGHIDVNDIQGDNKNNNSVNAHPSENIERVHGTNAVWSFSQQTIVTLRSSILCNYDKPDSMVLRLTPEQVQQIEDALKRRGSNWDEEQLAEAERRKKLQKALEDLRGDHAQALKRLNELESGNNDLQQELDDRKRELDKLNQFILDSGVSLQTPRNSAANSSLRSTPRVGGKSGTVPVPNMVPPLPIPLNATSTHKGGEDMISPKSILEPHEDAEARIEELERQLTRALHENPTAAQVQLLEDDLRALQEELRNKKEELDNFRNANVPNYYTSTALRMDQENSPEAQLAAAQQQIEEPEAALGEALENAKQQQQQLTDEDKIKFDELQGQIQKLQNELQQQIRDAEAAAERLNEELHAHKDTQQKLKDKEEELKALWDKQNNTEGETEATRDALRDSAQQIENLRDQLRAKEEEAKRLEKRLAAARRLQEEEQEQQQKAREDRAGKLHDVVEILTREANRQKKEASSTASVIEEVHKLLGKSIIS